MSTFSSDTLRVFYLLSLLLLLPAQLLAVPTGTIRGQVHDAQSGQPLEGVNIVIEDSRLGTTTDPKGVYNLAGISIGFHQISYSRLGYETRTKTGVLVKQNHPLDIDIELQESSIDLEGLTVHAARYFRESVSAPVSSTTLDIEEIRTQPSGSYDIQRAVQVLPSVTSSSDGLNEIIIRGGNFGENLFVIDNIEIDNPNHFAFPSSGGGPVSMITPELIEELTFYGGAFPSNYGDKTSSVLDVTTRDGSFEEFKFTLDMSMAGFGGNLEGPLFSDRGSYLLLYHRSFLSLLSESIGLVATPNYESLLGKQTFNLTPYRKLTFNQFWGRDWIDITHDDDSGYSASTGGSDIYSRSGQYTFGSTLKSIYENSFSQMTGFVNHRWWENDIYDSGLRSDSARISSYHSTETIFTLKYSLSFPETRLGALEPGLNLKYYSMNTTMAMRPDTVFHYTNGTADSLLTIWQFENASDRDISLGMYKLGGYLQWEKRFSFLMASAGLRYDYFSVNRRGTVAPTCGLTLPLPIMAKLRFGAGRYYQTPDYFMISFDEKNERLLSKYTDQAVLGIDIMLAEDFKSRIEAYYKAYHNVPVNLAMTTSEELDWSTEGINSGSGWARGIEVLLQKKVSNQWWGTLSYSWSLARAQDPRTEEQREYPWDFDYQHIFTTVAGYKFDFLGKPWYISNRHWLRHLAWTPLAPFAPSDGSEISLRFRYMGGQPYTGKVFREEYQRWVIPAGAELNNTRLPHYQRIDLHIHQHWLGRKMNIISYFEINNILNRSNIWKYFYTVDAAGVGATEAAYQWGRTLVGGIKVEF